jgi:hypothetical protein
MLIQFKNKKREKAARGEASETINKRLKEADIEFEQNISKAEAESLLKSHRQSAQEMHQLSQVKERLHAKNIEYFPDSTLGELEYLDSEEFFDYYEAGKLLNERLVPYGIVFDPFLRPISSDSVETILLHYEGALETTDEYLSLVTGCQENPSFIDFEEDEFRKDYMLEGSPDGGDSHSFAQEVLENNLKTNSGEITKKHLQKYLKSIFRGFG